MRDYYKRTDFLFKTNETTFEKTYFIRLNGVYVEVMKDVYDFCYYAYRKELRDRQRDYKSLTSLNALNSSEHSLEDVLGIEDTSLQIINNRLLMERIKTIIDTFGESEKQIAYLSLFENFSDEKIAKRLGMKRSTVNYHKQKIYHILRKYISSIEEWL